MCGEVGDSRTLGVFQAVICLSVRNLVQMELSEVTGSRCQGWSLVFSYCRVGELLAPLAASTWPKRGQIRSACGSGSNFPLEKGGTVEGH